MKDFYKQVLGNSFEPYEYQIRVAELLLAGRNVILSVPTGAGKTWASVMPFLYARESSSIDFPTKLVYSLPLRSLANSIYGDLMKATEKLNEISGRTMNIQTGEFSDDLHFEADIVFSTIDQTLSNFLCFPLPLSRAQANINAGSVVGSYLIFDEFHLLDEDRSMITTIGLLSKLSQLSRFCLMTATLTSDMMHKLKEHLPDCEIITLADFPEDKPKIHSLLAPEGQHKRSLSVHNNPISIDKVVVGYDATSLQKSIVLCNRVERAQALYQDLMTFFADKPNAPEIICLHARFVADDRQQKERRLKEIFGKEPGKESPPANAILISTQVIEAGMDITCHVMHTEISPINSFLQRIGRCARFGGEAGQVHVYNILTGDEDDAYNALLEREDLSTEDKKEIKRLKNAYLPYDRPICQDTFKALLQHEYIDETIANDLIEALLGERERKLFDKIRGGNEGEIVRSWDECDKSAYRDLVRDVQSVNVVLVREQDIPLVERMPFAFQSVSVYKWTVVKWLNQADKQPGDWLAKDLQDSPFIDNDEQPERTLQPVGDFAKITDRVFLNADYFGYDKHIGLNNFVDSTFKVTSPPRAFNAKSKDEFKPLTKDTFSQHTLGLLGCYEQDHKRQSAYAIRCFVNYFQQRFQITNLTAERIDELVRLMLLYHDYGKLNEEWANPMRRYQAAKEGLTGLYPKYLAHSDFDRNSEEDKKLSEKFLKKRPPHASAGACVILPVLNEWATLHCIEGDAFDHLIVAVAQAIGRHHSSLIRGDSTPFTISPEAHKGFLKLSKSQGFSFSPVVSTPRHNVLGEAVHSGVRPFYLWLVRILRLCDQKATSNLSAYLNPGK